MEREEKRLEQFRRLRKEIRGRQDYLVVGIDISKDTHNASPSPQCTESPRLALPLL